MLLSLLPSVIVFFRHSLARYCAVILNSNPLDHWKLAVPAREQFCKLVVSRQTENREVIEPNSLSGWYLRLSKEGINRDDG
jgi:hypothetical protein